MRRFLREPVPVLFAVAYVVVAAIRLAWLERHLSVAQLAPRLREATPFASRWMRRPDLFEGAVIRLSRWLPPRRLGPCLKESLLLLNLWARCGVPAKVHIGIRRSASGAWEGHAWLSTEESPVNLAGFTEMVVV